MLSPLYVVDKKGTAKTTLKTKPSSIKKKSATVLGEFLNTWHKLLRYYLVLHDQK